MEQEFLMDHSPLLDPNSESVAGGQSGPSNEPFRVVRFIHLQPTANEIPEDGETSARRTAIHSHAARAIHARRRRARTLAYQATRGSHEESSGQSSNGQQTDTLIPWEGPATAFPMVFVGYQGRSDPFDSFARPMLAGEHFLLDHCKSARSHADTKILRLLTQPQDLTHIIPHMKTECGRLRALSAPERESLTVGWVQLALSDFNFLNGLLLNACRSLSVGYQQQRQKQQYASLAIQYKLMCVKFVIDAISTNTEPRSLGDIIIAETLVLAFDEVGDTFCPPPHRDQYCSWLTSIKEADGRCGHDKAARRGRCEDG